MDVTLPGDMRETTFFMERQCHPLTSPYMSSLTLSSALTVPWNKLFAHPHSFRNPACYPGHCLRPQITANLREALANGRRGVATACDGASGPDGRVASGGPGRMGAALDETALAAEAPFPRFGNVLASAPIDSTAHAFDGE